MRIGFVTSEYVTEDYFEGGLANYLYRIALVLKKLGHEPVILVAADRNEEIESDGIRIVRVEKCCCWHNSLKFLSMNSFSKAVGWLSWSWSFKSAIKKIHQKTPFDVVQYSSYQGVGFFRFPLVPAVVRVSSYNPFLRKFDNRKLTVAEFVTDEVERISLKRADAVFGPGRLLSQTVERILGSEVTVIESPYIDTVVHDDWVVFENVLSDKTYLLFFGRLNPLKGILDIAKIIEQLLKEHPNLFFVFAGKDMCFQGQQMVDFLRDKAGTCKNRVIYLGSLRHNQLKPVIENALAVVLPSRIDNFPNTCIEAMAFGRIVVGTFEAGFGQLITDGLNGFLCHRDNPEELLETITLIVCLPVERRRAIGIEAKKRIELLSPDRVGVELVAYYHKVIASVNV